MTGWVSLNSRIQFIICEGGLELSIRNLFPKIKGPSLGFGFVIWVFCLGTQYAEVFFGYLAENLRSRLFGVSGIQGF